MNIIPPRFFVGGSLARCRGGDSRAQLRTCSPCRPPLKRHAPPTCHSEERSDVGISCRHLQPVQGNDKTYQPIASVAALIERLVGGQFNRRRALVHRRATLTCHCEERSDVAISQYPAGSQEKSRRKCNCLPEIATAPLGPRNDKSGAVTILTAACLLRWCGTGRGMPLQFHCLTSKFLRRFPRQTGGYRGRGNSRPSAAAPGACPARRCGRRARRG